MIVQRYRTAILKNPIEEQLTELLNAHEGTTVHSTHTHGDDTVMVIYSYPEHREDDDASEAE